VADQISVDLRMLAARRTDLICDRVRAINRLRATLLEYFPALEWAFDYSKNKAALTLLSEYQTPDRLRRMGATHQQFTTLPAEPIGSTLVIRLVAEITAIDRDLVELDAQLTDRFRQHEAAEILLSVPGFGPVLAATFLANVGGNLNGFDTVDRLAAVAGLAPVPYDSGRITGNLHRPRRFNRRLLRTCYLAALSSLKNSPASRAFYDRKRHEGKTHKQALIALARRRLNVTWALLRDRAHYQEPALSAA
jgi:transposase